MLKLIYLCVFAIYIVGIPKTKVVVAQSTRVPVSSQTLPIDGNTWQVSGKFTRNGGIIKSGIREWNNAEASFKSFFRIANPGILKLWVNAEVPEGTSSLEISIAGKVQQVELTNHKMQDIYVGEWNLLDTGYVAITLKGLTKRGESFANISDYKIAGSAINEGTRFVRNDEGSFFYWGRRGPSVHLGYQVPQDIDAKWYYNEIMVPEGEDIIGSYYMANGFSGGYFGIQVNSDTERRVLFSVWSPFVTDNPNEIPEEERIKMLKKGEDVYTGEFGNEGSGGQSYLRFNWKAGNTYKFLLKGEPAENDHTVYTAWFFAPEEGEWRLIASFSRPKTNSWLTGFHSFLENFSPNQGIYERKVLFSNQWVADKNDNWLEVNRARFTADNTARVGFRMDYSGGMENGKFYLRNCGFFSDYTPIGVLFDRPNTNQKPKIDLNKLP